MTLGRALIVTSAALFMLFGLGYLIAPGVLLAVIGVTSNPTNDFLVRTEGVALLTGAGLLWAVRDGRRRHLRGALLALAVSFILGSLVDLVAFTQTIAGPAALPSGAIRIGIGVVCFLSAVRLPPDPGGA